MRPHFTFLHIFFRRRLLTILETKRISLLISYNDADVKAKDN